MFLRDIPWEIMDKLTVMDYDGGWEKLASVIGSSWQEHQKFSYLSRQGKSPTQEIILKWSHVNATICDLHNVLLKIQRLPEASIVEELLRSQNMPIKEGSLNNFSNQNSSPPPPPPPPRPPTPPPPPSSRDPLASISQHLNQINSNNLPRPSEKNPENHSQIPNNTDRPVFHKPLNIDEQKQTDSVNVNKVTNSKDIGRVPKMDFDEKNSVAEKFLPSSKNLSSLIPLLELGYLFTYKDISCATKGFSEDTILGKGAFGTVYHGVLKETDYAIKKLTKDYSEVNNAMENLKMNAIDELLMQLKFRHPNVVNLYGYSLDSDETCFIYEYMENGSLEDCLSCVKNPSPLSWCERLKIAQGAACGLQYLHTQTTPIIHGDVKSSNILIDKHKEAKIGDFGLAMFATKGTDTGILTHVSNTMTGTLFGTVAYMPPEFPRSSGKQYLSSDVYSFGVVLHEILTGQKAYDENRTPKKFLMEYIDNLLSVENNLDLEDNLNSDVYNQVESLLDPKAGFCSKDTFGSLYRLAAKCTRSRKKDRPCMLFVFEELKRINVELESMKDSETKTSLPYQLQQMYDERNERSASGVSSSEETTEFKPLESCHQNIESEEDTFDYDLNSTDSSETTAFSSADCVRIQYEEKTLCPQMNLFFENYKRLTEGHNGETVENSENVPEDFIENDNTE